MNGVSTPREIVIRIIEHHGPVLGRQVGTLCASVGYTNLRSTYAVLFNAKTAGLIHKDTKGRWTAPK